MASTSIPTEPCSHWLCPDLRDHWQLARLPNSEEIVLQTLDCTSRHIFSTQEGYALQYFIGRYAIAKIQQLVAERYPDAPEDLVAQLLQKLVQLEVLRYEPEAIAAPEVSPAVSPAVCEDWLCPDLTPHWILARAKGSDRIFLKAIDSDLKHSFPATEGYALRYFNGKYAIAQAQQACQKEFPNISQHFVAELLQKLVDLGILQRADSDELAEDNSPKQPESGLPQSGLPFKAGVCWIRQPEHWILRNPEDVTFLQVSDRDKHIVDVMGTMPPEAIAAAHGVSTDYVQYLLRALTATAMLQGTKPPKPGKPKKFHPFQLLFFRVPLWNPDTWLSQHVTNLCWLWSRPFAWMLLAFLATSAVLGIHQRNAILLTGQNLLAAGGSFLLPFILLTALVITLHELGHAFTLKHFGGIVPEIGLLFMMLIPAAYTNTSDSYCLQRWQRVLVVGAGILVQFALMAIGFWVWILTNPSSWVFTAGYLLLGAAGFTIALNLNPLARFDGYYLVSALTGINNLRDRSFGLYGKLLTGRSIGESPRDALIMALYAPFCLFYLWFVFGFLIYRLFDWSFIHIPITALFFLIIWAIYYYLPESKPLSTQVHSPTRSLR